MENLVAPALKLFGNEIVRRRNGPHETGGAEIVAPKSPVPIESAFQALKIFYCFENNTEVTNRICGAFASSALLRLFFTLNF